MLDLVRCYYCHKELDGWEPKDVPWDEHKRGDCPYIKKGKKPLDLTGDDVFELEAERYCAILVRTLPSMYSGDLNTHFIKLTPGLILIPPATRNETFVQNRMPLENVIEGIY